MIILSTQPPEKLKCPNCREEVDDGTIDFCPNCNFAFIQEEQIKNRREFCLLLFIILLLILMLPAAMVFKVLP